MIWLALARVPAIVTSELKIYHLGVHPCLVHHPERLMKIVVIQNPETLEMNEEESEGVETEADISQIQNLQIMTSWFIVAVPL